jgi:hypothetical protein
MTDSTMSRTTETITGYEAIARAMLAPDEVLDNIDNGIRKTFVAKWAVALPLDRIVAITSALVGTDYDEDAIRAALRRAVKERKLRSFMFRGRRHWEIDFAETAEFGI